MGYVFDFNDAVAYDRWVNNPRTHKTARLENRLMTDMLKPIKGETLLDIGCGTGASLHPFLELGLSVTGIDPSPYMLDVSARNYGDRVDLYRGIAEDLPFEDNSFNHASLVTTLEFVDDPLKALEEACRVAKDRIFVGVLNRYAFKGVQRRLQGIFSHTIYNRARFFSVWEVKQMFRDLLGRDIPVSWRTVSQLPATTGEAAMKFETSGIVQRFPFGAFAGIVVTLVPRFKTRPLIVRHHAKSGAAT
ncbi:MAG: methyltransferase domain-containing protein [Deltaproteobacteria bacterium]|nr:methyltransferase domain-containing protein [Deltaproteobacteria bacterium]